MSDSVSGHVVVEPFVLNSSDCQVFILYLISLDITRTSPTFLTPVSQTYVEVAGLDIVIHDGPFVSVSYSATRGNGYRLPRIYCAAAAE